MCLAVPAQIVSIDDKYGYIKSMGVEGKVNIGLIENPEVGSYVLIHGGFAIQKIDQSYFNYLNDFFSNAIEYEFDE